MAKVDVDGRMTLELPTGFSVMDKADVQRAFGFGYDDVWGARHERRNIMVAVIWKDAPALLGTMEGDSLTVKIDYTIPRYRDSSVGAFLYAWLSAAGVRRLVTETSCPAHEGYLKKMGFVQQEGKFIKQL